MRPAAVASMQPTAVQLPADFSEGYVELAHRLAEAAAVITRKYFRYGLAKHGQGRRRFRSCTKAQHPTASAHSRPALQTVHVCAAARPVRCRTAFDVECKADASPVTIADKQAETAMRELLTAAVPEHGVFGEEHGIKHGSGAGAKYMWVLDPIDGTKSFITGAHHAKGGGGTHRPGVCVTYVFTQAPLSFVTLTQLQSAAACPAPSCAPFGHSRLPLRARPAVSEANHSGTLH